MIHCKHGGGVLVASNADCDISMCIHPGETGYLILKSGVGQGWKHLLHWAAALLILQLTENPRGWTSACGTKTTLTEVQLYLHARRVSSFLAWSCFALSRHVRRRVVLPSATDCICPCWCSRRWVHPPPHRKLASSLWRTWRTPAPEGTDKRTSWGLKITIIIVNYSTN